MDDKEYLTVKEAYSFLGISKAFFYQLIAKNKIQVYTFTGGSGKKTLYKKTDLLKMIEPRKT